VDPGHLELRRVERQQALIERLQAAHGTRVPLADLARELGVSTRTVARDVERLRLSGVPITAHQGRGGGVELARTRTSVVLTLDIGEAGALVSSLAVLGPTATASAASAMKKLIEAMREPESG
jgi:predicted DNA-binding transcriptional regulator YafY